MSELSAAMLERGHRLTALLREVEAEVSSFAEEVTADRPELLDAQAHSASALTYLQQARVELGILTQVVAEACAR